MHIKQNESHHPYNETGRDTYMNMNRMEISVFVLWTQQMWFIEYKPKKKNGKNSIWQIKMNSTARMKMTMYIYRSCTSSCLNKYCYSVVVLFFMFERAFEKDKIYILDCCCQCDDCNKRPNERFISLWKLNKIWKQLKWIYLNKFPSNSHSRLYIVKMHKHVVSFTHFLSI